MSSYVFFWRKWTRILIVFLPRLQRLSLMKKKSISLRFAIRRLLNGTRLNTRPVLSSAVSNLSNSSARHIPRPIRNICKMQLHFPVPHIRPVHGHAGHDGSKGKRENSVFAQRYAPPRSCRGASRRLALPSMRAPRKRQKVI
jgi:hypothetical protein